MNVHVERVIQSLQNGVVTGHTGFGNSMRPVILSGQKQFLVPVLGREEATRLGCEPFRPDKAWAMGDRLYLTLEDLQEGMAVFCKVGGNVYTHKIRAIRGPAGAQEFQISRQDEKRINGWTRLVYGKCVGVE